MGISEEDLKRLLKALAFAAHKHRDQRRKDVESSPCINGFMILTSADELLREYATTLHSNKQESK